MKIYKEIADYCVKNDIYINKQEILNFIKSRMAIILNSEFHIDKILHYIHFDEEFFYLYCRIFFEDAQSFCGSFNGVGYITSEKMRKMLDMYKEIRYPVLSDFNKLTNIEPIYLAVLNIIPLQRYIQDISSEFVKEISSKKLLKSTKKVYVDLVQEQYAVEFEDVYTLYEINLTNYFLNIISKVNLENITVGIFTIKVLKLYDTATNKVVYMFVEDDINDAIEAVASLYRIPDYIDPDKHIDYIVRQGDLFSIILKNEYKYMEDKILEDIRNNNINYKRITKEQYLKLLKYER